MTMEFNKTIGEYKVRIWGLEIYQTEPTEPPVVRADMMINDIKYSLHDYVHDGILATGSDSFILTNGLYCEKFRNWHPMPNYAHDFTESFEIESFLRKSLQAFVASQSPLIKSA